MHKKKSLGLRCRLAKRSFEILQPCDRYRAHRQQTDRHHRENKNQPPFAKGVVNERASGLPIYEAKRLQKLWRKDFLHFYMQNLILTWKVWNILRNSVPYRITEFWHILRTWRCRKTHFISLIEKNKVILIDTALNI